MTHRELLATVRAEGMRRARYDRTASAKAVAKHRANVRREMVGHVMPHHDDSRCADSESHGKLLWAVEWTAKLMLRTRKMSYSRSHLKAAMAAARAEMAEAVYNAALPKGMRCRDCKHAERCTMLLGPSYDPDSVKCDWYPPRFEFAK